MKMCTFLHFWERVKAKTTEEESEQREGGAPVQPASWKVCSPQMTLFLVIRASRVWTLSPACFLRRGDCLPGQDTPIGWWRNDITRLSPDNTRRCGTSTLRKHYFSALESLMMGCRNAELFLTASADGTNRTEQHQQVTEFKK